MALTWNNAGVEPSAEKQQTGYAAGEKLPAGHVNYFLNKFCKQMNIVNAVLSQTPSKVIFGVYTGNGTTTQQINLGFRPYAVILSSQNGLYYNTGNMPCMALDGYNAVTGSKVILSINDNGFSTINNSNNLNFYYIAFAPYSSTEE